MFEAVATWNYAVFVRLAACYEQVHSDADRDLFAVEGVYAFYSRLYSVSEAVIDGFLPAVGRLAKKYSQRDVPIDQDWRCRAQPGIHRFRSRIEKNGRSELFGDLKEAFDRANRYRHQRVRDTGFPARDGKIPKPEYVGSGSKRVSANSRGQVKNVSRKSSSMRLIRPRTTSTRSKVCSMTYGKWLSTNCRTSRTRSQRKAIRRLRGRRRMRSFPNGGSRRIIRKRIRRMSLFPREP